MKLKALCMVLAITAVMAAAFVLPCSAATYTLPVFYYDRDLQVVGSGNCTVSTSPTFYVVRLGNDSVAMDGYYTVTIPSIKKGDTDYLLNSWIRIYAGGTSYPFGSEVQGGWHTTFSNDNVGWDHSDYQITVEPADPYQSCSLNFAQARLADLLFNGISTGIQMHVSVVIPASSDDILDAIDKNTNSTVQAIEDLSEQQARTNELLETIERGAAEGDAAAQEVVSFLGGTVNGFESLGISPAEFDISYKGYHEYIANPLGALAYYATPQLGTIIDRAVSTSTVRIVTGSHIYDINLVQVWLASIVTFLGVGLLVAWCRGRIRT